MTMRDVAIVGVLGGIGFTVAIFISELAFDLATRVETAKTGVLLASVVCAIAAAAMLATVGKRRQRATS